jgi:glycosyltransferase involved in cell wall biosynthesis
VIYVRCRCRPLKDLRILLAGVDRGEWVGLRARAAEAGHPDAAEHLATPSDADLAALYRRAGALVYPSRYEGFGLPILEAMACGTPVIAARTGSIPAVAGTAAILLDPDDVEGFGDAIEQVLLSSGTAARLSADGRERAARFTWHRAAALTLEAYREVLGR